jgi:hypothetical protein
MHHFVISCDFLFSNDGRLCGLVRCAVHSSTYRNFTGLLYCLLCTTMSLQVTDQDVREALRLFKVSTMAAATAGNGGAQDMGGLGAG